MAQPGQTTIQLYSTTTTATTPSPSNLVSGELALNLTDKKIFSKDGSGTVVEMSMSPLNPSYTGTLTGGTGVVNLGSGQFVKDASGNVGVGAVPSAVAATTNTLQFEYGSGVTSATGGDLNINNNAYNSASNVWKYHTSGLGASRYQQDFGAHKWHTAPSGTAGNPISFTQAMTLDASGALLVGTTTGSNRLTVNSGAATTIAQFTSTGTSAYLGLTNSGASAFIGADNTGAFQVQTPGSAYSAKLTIDASGNLTLSAGAMGYGTGAGGTVTQATSKATAVTLNKPSGAVTMHNAALAAGASVLFDIYNTFFSGYDAAVLTGTSWSGFYRVETANSSTGSIGIRVTNTDSVSRSDPLVINFAIIKGAAA